MEHNARIQRILRHDSLFPATLASIPQEPSQIFFVGSLQKNARCCAIVGTRKASSSSVALAQKIASSLSQSGFVIVSGLALGIDAAAHRATLDAHGITLAVLGGGLDRIYPSIHRALASSIVTSGGCLISEYPPSTPHLKRNFLVRNRIISGLSEIVIIIEAPERSGSLSTALYAQKQGKKLFVVPGPSHTPHFRGSHLLIRNGARLVRDEKDILDDLSLPTTTDIIPRRKPFINDPLLKIFASSSDPLSFDKLLEITTLSAQELNRSLSSLVLEGKIEELHGNKYRSIS